jgi:hypothetical protein
MIRILLTGLVIYLSYHLFKGAFKKNEQSEQVRGKQKSSPLNLKDNDVEDAHFEDIDEREH